MVWEDVQDVREGTIISWDKPSSVDDWRKPLETSQHVPHSPLQRKMTSQTVHTASGASVISSGLCAKNRAYSASNACLFANAVKNQVIN